jgi:sirohydrochlorin cobaltochelatase
MRAIVLVGHGSVRPSAGAAMIRLAERARGAGLAPIVAASFLNYRQPTFAEALARCVAAGATEVVVQPYFLVAGKYVLEDLARLLEAARRTRPTLPLRLAGVLGDHPALARLLIKRALQADELAAQAEIATPGLPRRLENRAGWRPLHALHPTGLLIMAHGSPDPRSNAPIYHVAERVRAAGRYTATVCFLDLNQPSIPDAIDEMAARGVAHIIAVPYFLHRGAHVAADLPALIEAARQRHPAHTILLAEHLAYDQLLLAAIADRVAEATNPATKRRQPA